MQIVGVDHRELGTGPQNVERWDVFRFFCTWLHLVLWYNHAIFAFSFESDTAGNNELS